MKRFNWLVLAVITCSGVYGQQKTLSLKTAIETAIANNLDVRQRSLTMETSEVTWKQAKGNQLPDLIANVNHGINQGRSIDPFSNTYVNENITFANYNLSSSVILFSGLALKHTTAASRLEYEASKLELQQEKDNITLNVILAYLQALTNEELVKQSASQVGLTQQQVTRLEVLDRQGSIAPALLFDLKGQLANDELSVIDNRNSFEAAKLRLSQLMNIPYDRNLQLEKLENFQPGMYGAEIEAVLQSAMQQLAMVRGAETRTRAAEKRVDAARGNFSPTIFAGGNLGTNYSSAANTQVLQSVTDVPGDNFVNINGTIYPVFVQDKKFVAEKIGYGNQFKNNYGTTFNLGVRFPIINAHQARNSVALAKINLKAANVAEEAMKVSLRNAVEEAFFNMNASFERYQALQKQVEAFSQSFRAAEVRFNAGVGSVVDYLIAKNNLDRANTNLIAARYDYALRTRIIDYYQGKAVW